MKKIQRYYRIDYYCTQLHKYSVKVVMARSSHQALQKAKCQNIQGVQLLGYEREQYTPKVKRI